MKDSKTLCFLLAMGLALTVSISARMIYSPLFITERSSFKDFLYSTCPYPLRPPGPLSTIPEHLESTAYIVERVNGPGIWTDGFLFLNHSSLPLLFNFIPTYGMSSNIYAQNVSVWCGNITEAAKTLLQEAIRRYNDKDDTTLRNFYIPIVRTKLRPKCLSLPANYSEVDSMKLSTYCVDKVYPFTYFREEKLP